MFGFLVIGIIELGLGLLGTAYFNTKMAMFDSHSPWQIPKIFFTTAFALSTGLFLIVILDIIGIFSYSERQSFLTLNLLLLLLLLLIAIPTYLIVSTLSHIRALASLSRPALSAVSLVLLLVFLYGIWSLGNPFPELQAEYGLFSIEMGVTRVAVVGVSIMALLSGFGAAHGPLQHLNIGLRTVSEADIRELENRHQAASRQLSDREARQQQGRINYFGSGGDFELEQLRRLKAELWLELLEVREEQRRLGSSRTAAQTPSRLTLCQGALWHKGGYLWGAYCGYRVLMAAFNLLVGRRVTIDPISRGVGFLVAILSHLDKEFCSQVISFFFIGILISSSIRSLLLKFAKLSAYSSGETADLMCLFVTEVLGMYFVSSLLLMRHSLPADYRLLITSVVGDVPFEFYHRWFDLLFLPAACLSFLLFTVWARSRRNDLLV